MNDSNHDAQGCRGGVMLFGAAATHLLAIASILVYAVGVHYTVLLNYLRANSEGTQKYTMWEFAWPYGVWFGTVILVAGTILLDRKRRWVVKALLASAFTAITLLVTSVVLVLGHFIGG